MKIPPQLQSMRLLLLAVTLVLACESFDDPPSSLKAPGDCTPEEHDQLQNAVNVECKRTPVRCVSLQSCAVLRANWLQFQHCINARANIMNKCFQGGDDRHKQALESTQTGANKCWRLMEEKKCPLPSCIP